MKWFVKKLGRRLLRLDEKTHKHLRDDIRAFFVYLQPSRELCTTRKSSRLWHNFANEANKASKAWQDGDFKRCQDAVDDAKDAGRTLLDWLNNNSVPQPADQKTEKNI